MADDEFQPPSFSLGLDLDLHEEPQHGCDWNPVTQRDETGSEAGNLEEDDAGGIGEFGWVPGASRDFKRLRRGPANRLAAEPRKEESEYRWRDSDDDIENFSDEDWQRGIPLTNSVCSSSKSSLRGSRVVVSECRSKSNLRKREEASSASASASIDTERNGNVVIPKFTSSPLRKFQLIDSDSDDPSVIEDQNTELPRVTLSPRIKQSDCKNHSLLSNSRSRKTSSSDYQNQDLWNGFCSDKSSHIPTPAFDEVCNEYFRGVKSRSNVKSDSEDRNIGMPSGSAPPAHCYFFHKDSRIQELVRDRLPYFFPLRVGNNLEHGQSNEAGIDYMAQFGHHDNSKQTNQMENVEKSTTRSKKNTKRSQLKDNSQDQENWVNPKSSAANPRNASNRRVQAVGKSAGHWYTSSDGQRVYANKNGQELTGRNAYKQYRMESGSGFKKSKRKTTANKKTAAKKSAPRKK